MNKTLRDGRPIDETKRLETLLDIERQGFRSSHLLNLPDIFTAKEAEVQVALKISSTQWNTAVGEDVPHDPAISIAAQLLLNWPERWPVKYTPEPNIDRISAELDQFSSIAMLVGRAKSSAYRWLNSNQAAPHDHVKILLSFLSEAYEAIDDPNTQQAGQLMINRYMEILEREAKNRGIDYMHDKSWRK